MRAIQLWMRGPGQFRAIRSAHSARASCVEFGYPEFMQNVTIALPEELLEAITAPGVDLSRAALEALALEAYRQRRLSAAQLRRLLGYDTRLQVDAFLKEHGIELEYGAEDLERDRETHRRLDL